MVSCVNLIFEKRESNKLISIIIQTFALFQFAGSRFCLGGLSLIDLFSGAGGLTLGAARAGFDVAAAFENDPHAVETHKKNFPRTKLFEQDLSNDSIFDAFESLESPIAGVIGGPPCQGFSSIGRQSPDDIRNSLFVRFFECVRFLGPDFYLAENVMGILNPKYDSLRARAFALVSEYEQLDPLVIRASEYGVPTSRTRVFFIGYRKRGERDFCIGSLNETKKNAQTVYVETALKGLPQDIRSSKDNRGCRCIDPGFMEWARSEGHPFFERVVGKIPEGVGDPDTINLYNHKGIVTGCFATRHTEAVKKRFKALKNGSRDCISKAVRLDPNGFCPTIRAGTGPEKGSYQAVRPIHYSRNRVITPREAARLQGFPDWFAFPETIWHSFRQIGNSVSPLVGEMILDLIRQAIEGSGENARES